MTKLGVITYGGTACFYEVSHALYPKAVWLSGANLAGSPLLMHTRLDLEPPNSAW